jgi:sugar phosphate isomerase/epimerase
LLTKPAELKWLREWLKQQNAYVFTVNAFPRGPFHGTRVKEAAYQPDWGNSERVTYTLEVAEVLGALALPDTQPTISTVPLGHQSSPPSMVAVHANLHQCCEGLAKLAARTGVRVRLALEPEPMCLLGTSAEAITFFQAHFALHPTDREWLGVNLDACHHAVEFESPSSALTAFRSAKIPVLKVHLSAALALPPTAEALHRLEALDESTYFHQTFLQRKDDHAVIRCSDIPEGVAEARRNLSQLSEIRSHFHVPIHVNSLGDGLRSTTHELKGLMDALVADPDACDQFEIETYTWEVLPEALRAQSVEQQVLQEYDWALAEFARRGWNVA